MKELVINLHMHTTYSDGTGTYDELGQAALKTGVDVVLVTDHNVLVRNMDQYYSDGLKRVLVLACEEIHDQDRDPQKNHLLVFGTDQELAHLAGDPQTLISAVGQSGGLSFIAHPIDLAMPAFGERNISWEDWSVSGFTGIELWNGFSELKSVAKGKLGGIFYAFFPKTLPHGPLKQVLQIWDGLLAKGQRIVAIGGSDAHALHLTLGPIHKTVFPYEYHFSTINTHILTPTDLTGDLSSDREMILSALGAGNCFIGFELPAPTLGFRYSAQRETENANMGEEILSDGPVTLEARLPSKAEIRLIKDGDCKKKLYGDRLLHVTNTPGVYRIEAYKYYLGRRRGWIFSNPIYINKPPGKGNKDLNR